MAADGVAAASAQAGQSEVDDDIKKIEEELFGNHEKIHALAQMEKGDEKLEGLVKTVTAELGAVIEKYAPPEDPEYQDEDGVGIKEDGYGEMASAQPVVAAAKAAEIANK